VSVNIYVVDGNGGLDSHNFTLVINNVPPTIINQNSLNLITGSYYEVDYSSTDDDQGIITWSLKTNATTWLNIDSTTGVLSGTPMDLDMGSYWVNVSVDDGIGGTDSTNFTLIVLLDTDGDKKPDIEDMDDDNDGVNDSNDYYPLDSTKWKKPKKDGTDFYIYLIILVIIIITVILVLLLIKRGTGGELEDWQIEGETSDEDKKVNSFEEEIPAAQPANQMPLPSPPPPEDIGEGPLPPEDIDEEPLPTSQPPEI
jgi:hypothetical protein